MEILYDTMPTQDEVRHFMDSEIERIELEKIAKEEMEEDQRLFDAMDAVLAVKSSGNVFTADNICVIRDFNRSLNISGPEVFSVEGTLKRFIKERDTKASILGWDGVSRDKLGRPQLDTNSTLLETKVEKYEQLKKTVPIGEKMSRQDAVEKALEIPEGQPWLAGLTASEADQKLQDMEDGVGVKYNQGKLRHAQLIPALWIRRLTEVLEYGCSEKYTMHNWKGVPAEDFLDSGFRHLLDVIEGFQENGNALVRDSESQLYNIYQAAWNLLAAAYNLEKEQNGT